MSNISTMIGLWGIGLLTSEEVVTWADPQLILSETPAYAMTGLSLKGPQKCTQLPNVDFPPAREFSFLERLALSLHATDPKSDQSLANFAQWLADAGMGGDLSLPEIQLAYELEHDICVNEDMPHALHTLRENLPWLMAKHQPVAAAIWDEVA